MNYYEIILTGRVQGVGCRYYVYSQATRAQVNGTVRNLSNGSVKIILECTEDQLKHFIQTLQQNKPRHIHFDAIDIQTLQLSKHYHNFQIVYS